MYPSGHARNEVIDLNDIVANKVPMSFPFCVGLVAVAELPFRFLAGVLAFHVNLFDHTFRFFKFTTA